MAKYFDGDGRQTQDDIVALQKYGALYHDSFRTYEDTYILGLRAVKSATADRDGFGGAFRQSDLARQAHIFDGKAADISTSGAVYLFLHFGRPDGDPDG